ncbi:lactate permease [Gluconacetobacter liquefaciens]|uniref:L-lactate permease n=1 Tax=Gluconacetobacter liquefaciens TaxID=89584 RepID=A0A370FZG2_GLULI|nr:L-lactate permease [Gluconacetobacter liquefaciens]MBB2188056.1 L-lactate permease [Gluconacetobacter liquefaciens]RDI36166.1 lactate permease [Gluconacetobacter liquefaciens]GBQ96930.1 L-lactate permease [Gluconacetobacter liquefaciens NRIC 0522]GEB38672.1 lactate permease [Gluconacetobacter liquefaciens]
MFQQLLAPVGGSLGLSFIVAVLPVLAVLTLLGILRRPAWEAALAGLVIGLIAAIAVWRMPAGLAVDAVLNGAVFALWPVMWIVLSALLLYNIAVRSGRFDAFRTWLLTNLPNDRRVVLVVIGFCFGALLEGVSGFGTPVAITSSLLILVGFPALEALVFVLIFNTAPVAFGALGVPVTVLGAVTGLPAHTLAAMIGRQLPFIAIALPFYVMALYGGRRSLRALWPLLLVAGGSFALSQFVSSNYLDYALTDVLSALGSLGATLIFLRTWRPAPDPEFAIDASILNLQAPTRTVASWQGWLPWLIVSAVVILWTHFGVFLVGQQKIHWPGLDNAIAITLYDNRPYAAVWVFQPLATGTAILISAIITALVVRLSLADFIACIGQTLRQAWLAVITVMLIIGLAYLMNYSGMAYTLGKAVASTGHLFVFLSPFLGWVAVLLSGSDTSGNALFGNLQVVAARQLHFDPVLFAATNSSGGVMGKMVSPQNIATGVAVTRLKGQEGVVFARTFWHSIVVTLALSLIVAAQQFLVPWIIPTLGGGQ